MSAKKVCCCNPQCKRLFTPNKFHPHDQQYCSHDACRAESNRQASRDYRERQKQQQPLAESQRKLTGRKTFAEVREQLRGFRDESGHALCLVLGMLRFVAGVIDTHADIAVVAEQCRLAGLEMIDQIPPDSQIARIWDQIIPRRA
jgi:hypothetical protein